MTASTARPRRNGTDRQMLTRSVRISAGRSEAGCGREACVEVSSLSTSRAGRAATAPGQDRPDGDGGDGEHRELPVVSR